MNDDPNDTSHLPDPGDAGDEPDQDEFYEPAPKFTRTVDYMESDKGHEVTLRLVTMLEKLSPTIQTLLNAKIANQQAAPKLDFFKWLTLLVVRLAVFVVAIGALIYMRKVGTIDPAIALLIGGLVAYFFGYNRSQS